MSTYPPTPHDGEVNFKKVCEGGVCLCLPGVILGDCSYLCKIDLEVALVIPTMDEVVDPEVVCYTCALTGDRRVWSAIAT